MFILTIEYVYYYNVTIMLCDSIISTVIRTTDDILIMITVIIIFVLSLQYSYYDDYHAHFCSCYCYRFGYC